MELKLPTRPENGHKGTFGTVAVFGGSISGGKVMLGSAAFSAKAAIRSGVGMVVLLAEKDLLTQLIKMVPQAVGVIYSGHKRPEDSTKWQSIVIGPGLGLDKENVEAIQNLLELKLPTVIDADGLNMLSIYPELLASVHDKCLLTPHKKEFERLAKTASIENSEQLAAKLGCSVLLKSDKTYITNSKQSWTHESATPALATAGTGDVLAGLIGGLLAQYAQDKLSVFDCARLGVEIHSYAAMKWQDQHGSGGLIIEELLELIPETIQRMRD